MRPGRAEDLAAVLELWRAEVQAGRRDCAPGDGHLRRMLAGFDWASRSRLVDDRADGLAGAVLVASRATPGGPVGRVDPAAVGAGSSALVRDLSRWGLQLSRAAGAVAAQVWVGPGRAEEMGELDLKLVRPWWRMDRSLAIPLPEPQAPAGYELRDGGQIARGTWAEMHNRAFADHWRFTPHTEEELMSGRPPGLCLMAVSRAGRPAAVTLCQTETYMQDPRPQPVGVVSSVGTLPEHRRRGLASWLVAEGLRRLRASGARHASLYVDGWNHTRAFDAYRKLGFEVAFETEVWEATFP